MKLLENILAIIGSLVTALVFLTLAWTGYISGGLSSVNTGGPLYQVGAVAGLGGGAIATWTALACGRPAKEGIAALLLWGIAGALVMAWATGSAMYVAGIGFFVQTWFLLKRLRA